jgi:hypothetical protein
MEETFGTVLLIVCAVAIVIAVLSYWGSGALYKGIGKSGIFALDTEQSARPAPPPQSAAGKAEQREEIRQMLEAKSSRRERRGEAPLDIEAELEALLAPAAASEADPALREEVRQHVISRNVRRERQGKAPLDVEAEVERQLREFGA